MQLFNRLTIGSRLWLNLALVLGFVLLVTVSGWYASYQSASQAQQLKHQQQTITQEIAEFHKQFIQTLQQSNNYVLTLEPKEGERFNLMIDDQIQALHPLLISLGAQLQHDIAGFLELTAEPTGQNAELINQLFTLDSHLRNFKNATNANVFMKNRINDLLNYGINRSAAAINNAFTELEPLVQDQAGLLTHINELKERLSESQLIVANMIATQNTELKQEFDQRGLGFSAMPMVAEIQQAFSGDFFNRQIAQNLDSSYGEYFDSFGDIRDTLTTMTQNNESLANLSESSNLTLLSIMSDLQNQTIASLTQLETKSQNLATLLAILGAIAVLILLVINVTVTQSIVKPLNQMRNQVLQVAHSGEFRHWPMMSGNNELSEMSRAQAELLQSISQALNEIKTVSQALAHGDTQQRMSDSYQGDLKQLSQAFNQSLESVNATLNEMSQLSHALETGDLSFSLELEQHSGQFLEVLNAIVNALAVQKNAINDVRRVTHAMRDGQFDQRVEMNMPGELHNLKRYLNESLERLEGAINSKSDSLKAFSQGDFSYESQHQFAGKLEELNGHMGNMANSISHMLQDVKHATDHAVHGIKEISSGNQDLNQRVQKQAIAVQNTSSHMSVMMSSVRDTLNESQQVSHTTDQVQKDSASGLVIVEQMVEAMQGIQTASQQIAEITGLIDSIAFQTNLLALNAAVEAARAGEAGRGFAVVATEVRNLAQRSSEAAQQIRQVTDHTKTRIDQGMELSQQTQTVFEQNTASIERVAKMIIKMNRALEQQSNGIQEVTQALNDIDQSTQQNAALVEQIATTSSNIIEEVLGLEHKVSGFKLRALPKRVA